MIYFLKFKTGGVYMATKIRIKKGHKNKIRNGQKGTFNIMTFDGGGVKGCLSATLVDRLYELDPDIIDKTTLFSGTSIGSIIALALAYGLSTRDIRELFSEENVKNVFNPSYSELVRPKYNNNNLKQLLLRVFPQDLKLKDLKKYVIIPTFSLGCSGENGSWQPVFLNNLPWSTTSESYVIDAALSSSAAPIYFPSHEGCIDGGVVANDPSLVALIHAIDKEGLNEKVENIRLLSIGTGYKSECIETSTTGWGAIEWVTHKNPSTPLLSLMFNANTALSCSLCSKLLDQNYFKLNPNLSRGVALDSYSQVNYLRKLGENYNLDRAINWIENNYKY
jgi:patatin-like phospholipase/acyl hydrolase